MFILHSDQHKFKHEKITSSWGEGSKLEDNSQFTWIQVELKEEYLVMGLMISTTNGMIDENLIN